jgi:flagellin
MLCRQGCLLKETKGIVMMVINTNVGAIRASRALSESSGRMNTALARLASGSRIVSPADDAGGLAVASKFDAQINRNRAVQNNLSSALSYSQTADGFLQKVSKALDRMGELATLSLDTTKSSSDVADYEIEFADLKNYISDIGTKDFNGVSLFGMAGIAVTKNSDGDTWTLIENNLNAEELNFILDGSVTVTNALAQTTIDGELTSYIEDAIRAVSECRVAVGSNIQRIQFTQEQVGLLNENLQRSVSRIKDVDVATESTQFSRYNILVQSGTAMLAQANLLPQLTLRLMT